MAEYLGQSKASSRTVKHTVQTLNHPWHGAERCRTVQNGAGRRREMPYAHPEASFTPPSSRIASHVSPNSKFQGLALRIIALRIKPGLDAVGNPQNWVYHPWNDISGYSMIFADPTIDRREPSGLTPSVDTQNCSDPDRPTLDLVSVPAKLHNPIDWTGPAVTLTSGGARGLSVTQQWPTASCNELETQSQTIARLPGLSRATQGPVNQIRTHSNLVPVLNNARVSSSHRDGSETIAGTSLYGTSSAPETPPAPEAVPDNPPRPNDTPRATPNIVVASRPPSFASIQARNPRAEASVIK
ncbi:hypothetical protein BKA56DRAFT_687830 [Ilyonectria sp. MPI-CAGE-AT-0026]|nr:hypothetical protein BKA56DRAFT_687830 [Ilyonectria sp. MPI-CAGE-AT-0026]